MKKLYFLKGSFYEIKEGLNYNKKCLNFTDNINDICWHDDTVIADVTVPKNEKVYKYPSGRYGAEYLILSNIRKIYTIESMKKLINDGLDINKFGYYNIEYKMKIFEQNKDKEGIEVLEYIIKNRKNSEGDKEGFLNVAIENHCHEIIKFLIESCGANPNQNSLYYTLLGGYDLDFFKYLVEKSTNKNINYNEALYDACYYGRSNILKYLVEKCNASLCADNYRGISIAFCSLSQDIIDYFVSKGGDIRKIATKENLQSIVEDMYEDEDNETINFILHLINCKYDIDIPLIKKIANEHEEYDLVVALQNFN